MADHRQHRRAGPAARSNNLVVTEAGGEVLVYETDRHHIHHLNATTAAVWGLCDGHRDLTDIAQGASDALGAPVDEGVVRLALTKLNEAGLLSDPLASGLRVERISRRTLLRRTGIAGAIAVPAIVSVTAPLAAQGTSQCGLNCLSDAFCPPSCPICAGEVGLRTCVQSSQVCRPSCTDNFDCIVWSDDAGLQCPACVDPANRCQLPPGPGQGVCDKHPFEDPVCLPFLTQHDEKRASVQGEEPMEISPTEVRLPETNVPTTETPPASPDASAEPGS